MLPHVMLNKTTHPCGGNARPKNDVVPTGPFPSLPPYNHDSHRLATASIVPPSLVTAVAATSSWLRNRRIRYLLLLLCSPLLLCLLFFAFPFLCAVDLCLRRCLWRKLFRDSRDDEQLRRCEEGCSGCGGDEEKGLLHRYLEDQLRLVGSMYECGDDEDEEGQEEFRRVQEVENLHSSMTPLLS
ncbi:uncharacterized protein LOC129316131 [Prosopis cineraria]|uniref:uncharacterized protein LOC129316131 n=1 Tax=Prosopis cineraria TaxID=364024 RepID=UPI00240EAFE5|nr:uncharacterized protein LOC129316131 [Prosopis cineraria]